MGGLANTVVGQVLGGAVGGMALLLPGWVLATSYRRSAFGGGLSDLSFVATTAFGGLLVHLVALPFTLRLVQQLTPTGSENVLVVLEGHELSILLWAGAVFFVTPVAMGLGTTAVLHAFRANTPPTRLLARLGIRPEGLKVDTWSWSIRHQFEARVQPADEAREKGARRETGRESLAVVTLKGTPAIPVYGRLGYASRASNDASHRDLYLSEVWTAGPNGPAARKENTRGVWISGDQIGMVEFFEPTS